MTVIDFPVDRTLQAEWKRFAQFVPGFDQVLADVYALTHDVREEIALTLTWINASRNAPRYKRGPWIESAMPTITAVRRGASAFRSLVGPLGAEARELLPQTTAHLEAVVRECESFQSEFDEFFAEVQPATVRP